VRNLRAAIERLHPYYDAKYREVLRKIERDADARLDDAEMRALLEAARDVKLTSDQRSLLDAFVARQHQGRRGP
jgi:hypothetical protein